ncbi:unnamed protein product, partial [Amoebophrya sp. A120]
PEEKDFIETCCANRNLLLDHLPPFLGNQIATLAEFLFLGYQTGRIIVIPSQWEALYGETVRKLQDYIADWSLFNLAKDRYEWNRTATISTSSSNVEDAYVKPVHPLRVEWRTEFDVAEVLPRRTSTDSEQKSKIPVLDFTGGQLRDGPMRWTVDPKITKAQALFASVFRGRSDFYRTATGEAAGGTELQLEAGATSVRYTINDGTGSVAPVYGDALELESVSEDDIVAKSLQPGEVRQALPPSDVLPHEFSQFPCIQKDLFHSSSLVNQGSQLPVSARNETTHTFYQYKRACFLEFLKSKAVQADPVVVLRQTWHAFHGFWEPEDVGASSDSGSRKKAGDPDDLDEIPSPLATEVFASVFEGTAEQQGRSSSSLKHDDKHSIHKLRQPLERDENDPLNLESRPEPIIGTQFLDAFFAFFHRETLEKLFVRPYILAAEERRRKEERERTERLNAMYDLPPAATQYKCGLTVNADETTMGWHGCQLESAAGNRSGGSGRFSSTQAQA